MTHGFLDDQGAALLDLLAALETGDSGCTRQSGGGGGERNRGARDARAAAGRCDPACQSCGAPAGQARADIERMLTAMAGPDMDRIGGLVPSRKIGPV